MRTLSEWVRTMGPADAFVLGLFACFFTVAPALIMVNHEQRQDLIEMYEAEISAWEAVADRAYDQGRLDAERVARVAAETGE